MVWICAQSMTFLTSFVDIFLQGGYKDYLEVDEEVQQLLEHIHKLVQDNSDECKVSVWDKLTSLGGKIL